ncbi:hypothetical protein NDU88_000370 [Pleurodeles waltl]|uniref:Secreted protein n=1 Tax=Pleurodeles waltl TaxID=8319 RepID=A0AAV7S7J3_PLEWA|nr:hypothetical protein NDU88_000370 [Pleurodeles waltl]
MIPPRCVLALVRCLLVSTSGEGGPNGSGLPRSLPFPGEPSFPSLVFLFRPPPTIPFSLRRPPSSSFPLSQSCSIP